jgi:cell wall-associated NlpC family hydrolase
VYEEPAAAPAPAPEKKQKRSGKPRGHGGDRGALEKACNSWMGTPYRYGGESRRTGVDCSAYVQSVMRDAYGLKLPRTVKYQFRKGESVPRSRLEPGDLLFFNLSGRAVSHVGIYLGDGKFTHASTSQGVTVDEINRRIWRTRFVGARRVLP